MDGGKQRAWERRRYAGRERRTEVGREGGKKGKRVSVTWGQEQVNIM